MELKNQLMFPHIAVATQDDLFEKVASELLQQGYVKETYRNALSEREKSFPTGLVVSGGGVAIPHTDATHVNRDTFSVVTLDQSIPFLPMGGESEDAIPVETVIFLVFVDPHNHMQSLSRAIKAIQSEKAIQELHRAKTSEDLCQAFANCLGI